MKKCIAIVLTLVMTFALATSAMAEMVTMRYSFDVSTSSTSVFSIGCTGIQKTEDKWYISLNTSSSNLSETHRAVARVHCGYDAASPKFVYSGPSTTPHGYNANYQGYQSGLSFRARLDNRDSGTLEFHGTFITYYDPEC